MKILLKRLLIGLVTTSALFLLTANAHALSFVMGDYKFVLDGVSTFESTIDPVTNAPVATSGNLWGIGQIQAIFRDAVPGQGLYGESYWSPGDNGEYLSLRFGGMDLHYDGVAPLVNSGYHITDSFGVPVAANTYPHQSYFVNDNDGLHVLETGPETGANYAQIWLNTTDTYGTDVFGVGANVASDGALGTFGTTMAAAGTLVLDMEFAAGALWVDEMVNVGLAAADQNDIYRAVTSLNTRNETLGYLDIIDINTTWGAQFNSNGWFTDTAAGVAALAAIGRTDGFDIRIEASNSSASHLLTQAMIDKGWNARTESSSALAHANPIPEPGTIFLLGTGLLCLAGISRKKFNN